MRSLVIVAIVAFFATCNAFTVNPRIVEGQKAKTGQFPYYAFLKVYLSGGQGAACGASLVSDEWLVTAAHCINGAERLDVILGESDLENLGSKVVADRVEIDGLHMHPEYDENETLNDIALIHLPQKVQFTKDIKPVSLPKNCEASEICDAVAIGHGKTSNTGDVSTQLNYAFLSTISLNDCEEVFPLVSGRKSVICAVSTEKGKQSVCNGDSGGPLVRLSDNTLIGVSDFVRKEGCETGLPQGFSNVYQYLSWIHEVTGLDLPKC